MKLSIITITLDNPRQLLDTLSSVYGQILPDGVEVEHIVVDGMSSAPGCSEALAHAMVKGSRVVSRTPQGVYRAINDGIRETSGDVIWLVHAGDRIASADCCRRFLQPIIDGEADFVFGDICYSPRKRHYSARNFTPDYLRRGISPPHPSLLITAEAQEKIGLYKEHYRIASDFDMFIRLFDPANGLRWKYVQHTAVVMDSSGVSSKPWNQLFANTKEKYNILREHGHDVSVPRLLTRYFYHLKK